MRYGASTLKPPVRAERLFRVDPRLVHATMMNVWVPTTGARLLLIADATVAADTRRRAILEMSAMGEAEVRFTTELEAAAELERCDPAAPVIVLFSSLEDALRAVQAGLRVDRLNVGHVPEAPGRMPMHPAVHLGPPDYSVIEHLQARGTFVFVQPLPQDKAIEVARRPSTPPAGADSGPRRRDSDPDRLRAVLDGAPATDGLLALDGQTDHEAKRIGEQLRVVNAKGLHLRAAHRLAHLAGKLPCEVRVASDDGGSVNAKSLLGLTTLGATCGTLLEVEVEGAEAEASMRAIRDLFATGFDEGADWTIGAREEGR